MTQWQISFPIDGLHNVIKEPNTELTVGKVKFYYRDNQHLGSTIVDSDQGSDAGKEAVCQINKALSRICFAYNSEASLREGYYAVNLTDDPNNEWTYVESVHRWSVRKEDPSTTLSKLELLDPGKMEVLDLGLAYYKMSEYANPLRIESFFSCITVLARELLNKGSHSNVTTRELKDSIKDVYRLTSSKFDESQFDQD